MLPQTGKIMKKSGSHFKPRTSVLRRFRTLLTIVTILMLIGLVGAVRSYNTKNKNTQDPQSSSSSLGGTGGLTVSNQPTGNISLGNEAPQAERIIEQINNTRKANGVSPVSRNSLLDQSSVSKLSDMVSRNYWAHNAPNGTEPWVFIQQTGYKYRYAGENLWYGHRDSPVADWLISPTHKAVMLDARYTEIGIAIQKASSYNGEQNVYVIVTHYASPLSGSTSTYVQPNNTSTSSGSGYQYQLPNYSSTPPPNFDRPSPTYTPPPQQCVGNTDSSYSC